VEVVLVTGPEGGLTAGEVAALCARGFRRAGLGPRILRADTAAIALLAALTAARGR
jgi:16S rRNA (uracil1498-N3)-methyltransferase